MSGFFFFQLSGGDEPWQEALASAREQIIAEKKPRFVTVLNLFDLPRPDMTREEIAAIRYEGPLYLDLDDADIGVTIEKMQAIAGKLNALGVDLNAVRFFCTGGRGLHCEIDQRIFMPKVPPKGIANLPYLYREMVFEALYVDSVDMRVYSGRSGRMWRTPGVQRENNYKYKVPITVDELLSLTPETYNELTAAPRPMPALSSPVFTPGLGLVYEKARLKFEAAVKKRGAGARDLELLKRFKGDFPPTIAKIMAGEGIKAGAGFHQLALQIAITANALGKSPADTVAASEGLIQSHVSDSQRYGSPDKRRAELERLLQYTDGNPVYSYSKGPIKVLVAPGTDTADLDGMPDAAGDNLAAKEDPQALDLRGGLELRENGLYKKGEQGVELISDIVYRDVRLLMALPKDDKAAELWGFEADVFQDRNPRSRQQLDLQIFLSKARYQEFALRNMGIFRGSDNDVASLSTILRDLAMKEKNVAYVVRREGMDYVTRPDSDPPTKELIWVESSGVYGATAMPYIFRPAIPSGSVYQSDIQRAADLTGDATELAFFESLFNLNDPHVIAPMLGWYASCYHRMIYEALFGQFPLLQPFGQAGSGKTKTTLLLANMHFYSTEPLNLQCSQLTPYYLQVHASASASIPMVLDEYKPRQMPAKIRETLPNVFRAAYNNGAFGKGGEGDQIGQGWKSISKLSYSAPVVFIGEALETESAIMERTVAVPMSKSGVVGRSKHLRAVEHRKRLLSSLGKALAINTFKLDLAEFERAVDKNIAYVEPNFAPDTHHRVIFNLAVVVTGFDFMSTTLRQVFGGALDTELARLRECLLVETAKVGGDIMAEASKVLDVLAFISKNEEPLGPYAMRNGHEYLFSDMHGVPCIDISLQPAFVKYVSWCRNKGQVALYDNFEAFCHGLGHYAPVVDRACMNSPLKTSGLVKVYRFSLQKLTDESVQNFRL